MNQRDREALAQDAAAEQQASAASPAPVVREWRTTVETVPDGFTQRHTWPPGSIPSPGAWHGEDPASSSRIEARRDVGGWRGAVADAVAAAQEALTQHGGGGQRPGSALIRDDDGRYDDAR
jgi:hypothetical protein